MSDKPTAEKTVPEKKVVVCPACGTPVKKREEFCLKCGEKLTEWPEDTSARQKKVLTQAPLAFAFCCLTGILSIIFMMPVRWIIGIASLAGGTVDSSPTAFLIRNIFSALIGIAVCFIGIRLLCRTCGQNEAIFVLNEKQDRAFQPKYALMMIGIAAVAYFCVAAVFDYQYITGPVIYFANLFSGAEPTTKYTEIATGWKILSFLIHLAYAAPAMYLGYKKGYDNHMEAEADSLEHQ